MIGAGAADDEDALERLDDERDDDLELLDLELDDFDDEDFELERDDDLELLDFDDEDEANPVMVRAIRSMVMVWT